MAEDADYNPGHWAGYDFKSARAKYDAHAGRSYDDAVKNDKTAGDLVPENLKTDSEAPVVIACDVTGSMGEWPATIFSKLPYLDLEGKEYLGQTMEISFAAIGDVFSDKFPLQVQKFCAGKDMETSLQKLVIEGGGGGQTNESYDLGALYYSRNCEMPKAIQPIFIFIGDEGIYETIESNAESWAHTKVEKSLKAKEVFEELKRKFSVYVVRKPYGGDTDPSNRRIQNQWEEMLGSEHVVILPEAGRVVDVIFGIFAKETGRFDYFKKELKDRQTDDQVNTVMTSLKTIHLLDDGDDKKSKGSKKAARSLKKLPPGASYTRRPDDKGKDSISLL